MGSHPLNLALRFLLELAALLSLGLWGWRQNEGWFGLVLAFCIPVLVAVIWGTLAVPDDPSRSGSAPVAVAGALRLAIELLVFAAAVWALFDMGFAEIGWTLGIIVVIHYLSSYDRLLWLFAH